MNLLSEISFLFDAIRDPFVLIALIGAAALGLGYLRQSYGFTFFSSIALTFAATHILKSLFHIPRPADALVDAVGYRFPSMHASLAGVVMANLAWHMVMHAKHRGVRIAIICVALALITLIGATRLYLGVHEAIDVIVGALLGLSIGICINALFHRLKA